VGLRSKLLALIFSVVVLPPLTIVVQFVYQVSTGNAGPEIRIIATRLIAGRLQTAVEQNDYAAFAKLPSGADLVIVSDEGTLLHASSERARSAAESAGGGGPAALAGAVAAAAGDRDFYAYRYSASGGKGTAYLTVPGKISDSPKYPVAILPAAAFAMLAVVSVFAVLVVRGLGRSIRRLEDAMDRIASGDLDFPAAELARGDLASLGRSLDRMRGQLKEDRERRDRFIMGVSHDLKTPLAVIQGYLDALGDGLAKSEEQRERYLEIMRGKADLLGSRIAHLIELAKTTTGDWRGTLEEADFGAFLEETLAPLAEFCAIQGRVLERRIALPAGRTIAFDRDMAARAIENLIDNAVAYGDRATPIVAEAREDAAERVMRFSVENGGQGIAEEDRKKVFEPFFRGSRNRADGGFGLGLASVKSIVESHGWSIRLESEPGARTAFIIEIPY
jgi:signal transduction histidine kinase